MNAFEAAASTGRAGDLQRALEAVFVSQNKSADPATTIFPVTYMQVEVAVS